MNSVLAGLEEGVARNAATVSEELPEQERTNEELRALIGAPSLDHTALENLLERERARRTLVLQNMKAIFQVRPAFASFIGLQSLLHGL